MPFVGTFAHLGRKRKAQGDCPGRPDNHRAGREQVQRLERCRDCRRDAGAGEHGQVQPARQVLKARSSLWRAGERCGSVHPAPDGGLLVKEAPRDDGAQVHQRSGVPDADAGQLAQRVFETGKDVTGVGFPREHSAGGAQ